MVRVRSCGVADCLHNNKAGHCEATEIDVGKRLECLTFVRDNVLLREQLHNQVKTLYAEG